MYPTKLKTQQLGLTYLGNNVLTRKVLTTLRLSWFLNLSGSLTYQQQVNILRLTALKGEGNTFKLVHMIEHNKRALRDVINWELNQWNQNQLKKI